MADRFCDYEEDVQCGRCGSSMGWEDCGQCDDGEVHLDDSEHFDEWRECDWCKGRGGWYLCLSHSLVATSGERRPAPGEPTWCEAHPNDGRDEVSPGTEEPFIIHQVGCPKATADGRWTELIGGGHGVYNSMLGTEVPSGAGED